MGQIERRHRWTARPHWTAKGGFIYNELTGEQNYDGFTWELTSARTDDCYTVCPGCQTYWHFDRFGSSHAVVEDGGHFRIHVLARCSNPDCQQVVYLIGDVDGREASSSYPAAFWPDNIDDEQLGQTALNVHLLGMYPHSPESVLPGEVPDYLRTVFVEIQRVLPHSLCAAGVLGRRWVELLLARYVELPQRATVKKLPASLGHRLAILADDAKLRQYCLEREVEAIRSIAPVNTEIADYLATLKRMGDLSAHEAQDDSRLPDREELEIMLEVIEYLCRAWFVEPARRSQLADRIRRKDEQSRGDGKA